MKPVSTSCQRYFPFEISLQVKELLWSKEIPLLKIPHFNIYLAQIIYGNESVAKSPLFQSIKHRISNLNRTPRQDIVFGHCDGLYS